MFLALKFNSNTAFSRGKFKHLTELLTSKNINIKNFCLSKAHKTVWNSKEKFNITKSMRDDIDLLTSMKKSPTAFLWEILVRYFIFADDDHTVPGGAFLIACRACCLELKFWNHA